MKHKSSISPVHSSLRRRSLWDFLHISAAAVTPIAKIWRNSPEPPADGRSVHRLPVFRSKRGINNRAMAPPPVLALALPSETGRVLSIQSHTVQGNFDNKLAVFPLQLLGYNGDPIHSVQFSNHTGYPTFKGQVLNGDQLWDLIEGLQANNLLYYTHLLTDAPLCQSIAVL